MLVCCMVMTAWVGARVADSHHLIPWCHVGHCPKSILQESVIELDGSTSSSQTNKQEKASSNQFTFFDDPLNFFSKHKYLANQKKIMVEMTTARILMTHLQVCNRIAPIT